MVYLLSDCCSVRGPSALRVRVDVWGLPSVLSWVLAGRMVVSPVSHLPNGRADSIFTRVMWVRIGWHWLSLCLRACSCRDHALGVFVYIVRMFVCFFRRGGVRWVCSGWAYSFYIRVSNFLHLTIMESALYSGESGTGWSAVRPVGSWGCLRWTLGILSIPCPIFLRTPCGRASILLCRPMLLLLYIIVTFFLFFFLIVHDWLPWFITDLLYTVL